MPFRTELLTVTSTLVVPPASPDASSPDDSSSRAAHRVVLVDPREERRAISGLLIERCDALTVVGLAANLAEADPQIRAARADVALLEIQPLPEGLATIAALRDRFPGLCIVVCSFHSDLATREAARAAGADGYLTKPLQVADLVLLVAAPARTPTARDQSEPTPQAK